MAWGKCPHIDIFSLNEPLGERLLESSGNTWFVVVLGLCCSINTSKASLERRVDKLGCRVLLPGSAVDKFGHAGARRALQCEIFSQPRRLGANRWLRHCYDIPVLDGVVDVS